jgi:hypothetical protein
MMTAMDTPIPAEMLAIVPANMASDDDLAAIFGTADYLARCQCQRLKVPGWFWRDTTQEERTAMLREQSACGDPRPPADWWPTSKASRSVGSRSSPGRRTRNCAPLASHGAVGTRIRTTTVPGPRPASRSGRATGPAASPIPSPGADRLRPRARRPGTRGRRDDHPAGQGDHPGRSARGGQSLASTTMQRARVHIHESADISAPADDVLQEEADHLPSVRALRTPKRNPPA